MKKIDLLIDKVMNETKESTFGRISDLGDLFDSLGVISARLEKYRDQFPENFQKASDYVGSAMDEVEAILGQIR